MDENCMNSLKEAIFAILEVLAVFLVLVIFCVAWVSLDRLGWVRFISALPIPGWLKMLLWGWV